MVEKKIQVNIVIYFFGLDRLMESVFGHIQISCGLAKENHTGHSKSKLRLDRDGLW